MVFPLKDYNPTRTVPFVTVGLIALNILVFVYELALGPDKHAFIAAFGATPYEITHGTDLVGRHPQLPLVHTAGPPIIYLTVLTSMFMHAGVFHIFGNMLYLWIFGNNIEDTIGHGRFLLFYLLSGIGAAAAHILAGPNSVIPTVGASGAVSGVLGAYLIAFPRAKVLTLIFLGFFIRMTLLPASVLLIFWFVIQAFSGFLSIGRTGGGVAWFAHIGGFVVGVVLFKLMSIDRPPRRIEPADDERYRG